MEKKENKPSIKELVLKEYKKGNLVVLGIEGIQVAPLKEIIKQPIDGLLYDLNRNESVILAFIDDLKWINDYALVQVLREFKNQLESKDERISFLEKELSVIEFPSEKQVESILDKWTDRHSESWDYESDRANVKKAILEYKRKIFNKNK